MAVTAPVCDFGAPWHDFALPDTAGRLVRLEDVRGPRGLLIMFICNHCPYVQAVLDRILRDAGELLSAGVGVAAISSNDVGSHPEDGPDEMRRLAESRGFPFPYLYDETQDTARAYGAQCTPDFFGYNSAGQLQYRGRLDASGRSPGPTDARRELFDAMLQVAQTGHGPAEQVPSIGCSIKWKES